MNIGISPRNLNHGFFAAKQNRMETINIESNVDVLLSNVTGSNIEEDFYAEAKTYLTYKMGKLTNLLTVFVFRT